MSRAKAAAARPHRPPTTIAATVGYRLLLYLCSLVVLVGGTVAVAYLTQRRESPRPAAFWILLWVLVTIAVLMYEPHAWFDPHPALYRLCCGFAVVATIAFAWALVGALDKQALLDRGVVETAVVAVEHPDRSLVTGYTDYSYTLTGEDGREIPRSIAPVGRRLGVGSRVTVLVDPRNEVGPSLALHPSDLGERIVAGSGLAIAVAGLTGLAITAPRPAFGSSRRRRAVRPPNR